MFNAMNTFHAKVAAGLAGLWLLVTALGCSVEDGAMRSCMRGNLHSALATGLHIGAAAVAIWVGMECAARSYRNWLGWVSGLVLFVLLACLLEWLGYPMPHRDL